MFSCVRSDGPRRHHWLVADCSVIVFKILTFSLISDYLFIFSEDLLVRWNDRKGISRKTASAGNRLSRFRHRLQRWASCIRCTCRTFGVGSNCRRCNRCSSCTVSTSRAVGRAMSVDSSLQYVSCGCTRCTKSSSTALPPYTTVDSIAERSTNEYIVFVPNSRPGSFELLFIR